MAIKENWTDSFWYPSPYDIENQKAYIERVEKYKKKLSEENSP